MPIYTCRYCGAQAEQAGFARARCAYSPSGRHELLHTTEELPIYTCKFCGKSYSYPGFAGGKCQKNGKRHELLD